MMCIANCHFYKKQRGRERKMERSEVIEGRKPFSLAYLFSSSDPSSKSLGVCNFGNISNYDSKTHSPSTRLTGGWWFISEARLGGRICNIFSDTCQNSICARNAELSGLYPCDKHNLTLNNVITLLFTPLMSHLWWKKKKNFWEFKWINLNELKKRNSNGFNVNLSVPYCCHRNIKGPMHRFFLATY